MFLIVLEFEKKKVDSFVFLLKENENSAKVFVRQKTCVVKTNKSKYLSKEEGDFKRRKVLITNVYCILFSFNQVLSH